MDRDFRTDSPKADFCYRFVRRFSDTVGIVGSHGEVGGPWVHQYGAGTALMPF